MTHRFAFAVLPLLIAVGCTGGPTFAPVSGKVIKDGKPMAGASLTFQPNSSNNPGPGSYGRTDASGVFELKVVTTDAPGAVVGTHLVYITPAGKVPDPKDDTVKFKFKPYRFEFVVPPEGTKAADFDVPKKR
jgi:hypothetical protein